MKSLRTWSLALVALAVVTGCGTAKNLRQADQESRDADAQIKANLQQMRAPQAAAAKRDTVVVSNEPWVDLRPMRAADRNVPSELTCIINFKPLVPMSLLEMAQQISSDCAMPVRVTPDAIVAVTSGAAADVGASTQPSSAMPTPGMRLPNLPRLPAGPGAVESLGQASSAFGDPKAPGALFDIDYKGPVSGLLDLVTARNGLSWRYNGATRGIAIFYIDSRTFRINAFPNVVQMQSTMQTGMTTAMGAGGGSGGAGGSSGGGIGGNGGSTQTTSVTMQTELYADIEATIKSILTPGAGRMAMSPSTGTVSVTDTPEVLDRVEALLAQENATLTKQIIFHTKILSVSTDSNDAVGVNWDAVYQSLSGKYGLNFRMPFTPAAGAGTLGATVLGNGPFSGSNLVVSALSKLGTVRTITSPSATTLNLRPVPVQIARQIGYIASSQIAQTQGAGTTGGLTPGSVTVGFNMNLVPRLLEDENNLLVQYAINISALNQMRSTSAAGTTIESPDLDLRLFNGEVNLRSGETLILHGFEQDSSGSDRRGMFSPFAWMVGGDMKANRGRQAVVILITPEVVNRSSRAQAAR